MVGFSKIVALMDCNDNNVYNMNEGVRDRLWIHDFRMKHATFLELVEVLRPYIQHQHTRYREPLPVTKPVAMVLHNYWQKVLKMWRWVKHLHAGVSLCTSTLY
jgi:hypothetical protein